MEINWSKVRRVILDDRWRRCYKPDMASIKKIGWELPDSKILGFSFYPQAGYWCLLVEDSSFLDNPYGIILDISISRIGYKPLKLISWLTESPKK